MRLLALLGLFINLTLSIHTVKEDTNIYRIRLLTFIDAVNHDDNVNKGIVALSHFFDTSYRKFSNPTTGTYCQNLQKDIQDIQTVIYLLHDKSQNCSFDTSSMRGQLFHQAVEPASPTLNWNKIVAGVMQQAWGADAMILLKATTTNVVGEAQANKLMYVSIGLVVFIIVEFIIIMFLLYVVHKRKKRGFFDDPTSTPKVVRKLKSKISQRCRRSRSKKSRKSRSTSSKSSRNTSWTASVSQSQDGVKSSNCSVPEVNNSAKTSQSAEDQTNSRKTLEDSLKLADAVSSTNSTKEKKDGSGDSELDKTIVMRSDATAEHAPTSPPTPPKRSKDLLLADPITSNEFKYYLNKLSKIIIEYYDDPTDYSVTPNATPGFVYKSIPKTAPEEPQEFNQICSDFKTTVLTGITHWQHPRFHAYFPAGRNYACMMADLLISSMGVVGFSWDSCPALTEMEHAMVNWVGRAFGLPEAFLYQDSPENSPGGGCMFETASEAIHSSLLASRQKKIQQLAKKEVGKTTTSGISYDMRAIHSHCRKLVVYTSKDAHSSIEKGCKLALMRCRPIQAKEKNDWGLTGEDIEKEIIKDIEKGLVPTHIHLTIGTTSNGASDHIDSIWPIAKKYDMWIHVDAAYAGSSWIDPKHRINCAGLEHVNSIDINLHKFLMHSVGCSVFWTKDQTVYKDAFAITPVYLKPTHVSANDLRDWGVQLSRRFMCLKTWIILRMYGVQGLRNYVNNLIDMAIYFESLVKAHPFCRIFGKRHFALFCFQYVEPGMTEEEINTTTQKLCQFMNASHKIFLTHTRIANHNMIRVSINYERSTKSTIDESWSVMQDLMLEFRNKKFSSELPIARDPLVGRKNPVLVGDVDYGIAGSVNNTDTTRSGTSGESILDGMLPGPSGSTEGGSSMEKTAKSSSFSQMASLKTLQLSPPNDGSLDSFAGIRKKIAAHVMKQNQKDEGSTRQKDDSSKNEKPPKGPGKSSGKGSVKGSGPIGTNVLTPSKGSNRETRVSLSDKESPKKKDKK